ncbi:unnamed protein product [Urochloa humidicola]
MEHDEDPISYNQELRDMGLPGDDEDDHEAGREALFGSSADVPIDVADAEGGGSGTPSESVSNKRTRTPTSKAWLDFDPIYAEVGGKMVRKKAKCKHCKKLLAGRTTIGTGHLLRHIPICPVLKGRKAMAQSQLNFKSDGSGLWEYSPDVARSQLCRLIARMDLPISFGESDAFKEYIQIAHNPRFTGVSRQTTTRDIAKYFNDRRAKLIDSLNVVSSVALTSDIWSGNAKEDYLSVVAHYVNSDWQLEKRILGMRLIDVSHNSDNIAERVSNVVAEYGLTDKIFSVTLDNASANTKAIEKLSPLLSGYIGSVFLHQRCACHIINLIVKAGLDMFKPMLVAFRSAISFLNSSNQRIAAYKSYCLAVGVRPRKFGLDMDVRWNATYLMLKHLIPHKESFSVWITAHLGLVNGEPLLTDNHWYAAEKVLGFLEQFYESTVVLSGVYYPTAPLVLHHVLEIASHLNAFENDKVLRNVVVPMKTKYLEYWMDIPMLYSFAFILDPRAKMKGFTNVLRLLSDLNGNDYSCYLTEVRAELSEIFRKYEDKFGAVRLQRATPTGPTGKRKTNWGKIFGDGAGHSAGSIGGASPGAGHAASAGLGTALGASAGLGAGPGASSSLSRRTSASALLQAATSGASLAADSELSSYLDSDTVNKFDDDFDILTWWQEHKLTYPILSILARDVMTVPVSTISSESAFSLTGRIIEERRRRLTPEMVEMLALVKDWEQGDSRTQHEMEDKELEDAFENLYLDDDTTSENAPV